VAVPSRHGDDEKRPYEGDSARPAPLAGLNADLRRRLDFEDGRLLAECEIHYHRTGGPGGQHRNKVSTAVRLHHRLSGIIVTGTERRSQQENRLHALRRLREALAVYTRAPLPEKPVWPPTVQISEGRLHVNPHNPAIYHVLGLVLDAVFACGGSTRDAAAYFGVTPTSLTRFLAEHPKAWAEANRIRAERGARPLRS
jgi:hypothetical protein